MFWRRRSRTDDDFAAEVQAHLQLEADRLRAEGLSEEDAHATARRGFGNVMLAQERFYQAQRLVWLHQLGLDLRYAVRTLRRSPGFTLAASGGMATLDDGSTRTGRI